MNSPKRHHEIPQMILNNFVDEKGKLYCLRKQENRTFATSPQNVFVRHELYAIKRKGLDVDTSKEHELATQIEAPAHDVISQILSCARTQKHPNLSRNKKMIWDKFLYSQAMRTYSTRLSMDDPQIVLDAIKEFELNVGPLTPEEQAIVDTYPQSWKEDDHETWLEMITAPIEPLYSAIRNKGLLILILEHANKSYVIGDTPILSIIPSGANLDHPDALLLFPIAHDVAVACFGRSSHVVLSCIPGNNEGTSLLRKINESILAQSSIIACKSKLLVESFCQ